MSTPDRRSAPRRRVLKGASVVFNGRKSSLPCKVRNISETGAQLEFETSFMLAIPETFSLFIELDGIEVPCSVVRKSGCLVGVRFDGPIEKFKPTRAQVVMATAPITPSLRKKPISP